MIHSIESVLSQLAKRSCPDELQTELVEAQLTLLEYRKDKEDAYEALLTGIARTFDKCNDTQSKQDQDALLRVAKAAMEIVCRHHRVEETIYGHSLMLNLGLCWEADVLSRCDDKGCLPRSEVEELRNKVAAASIDWRHTHKPSKWMAEILAANAKKIRGRAPAHLTQPLGFHTAKEYNHLVQGKSALLTLLDRAMEVEGPVIFSITGM